MSIKLNFKLFEFLLINFIEIYFYLKKIGENIFLSPFSILSALSVVLNGSDNEIGFKNLLEMNLLKKEDILSLNKKYLNYLKSIDSKIEVKNQLFADEYMLKSVYKSEIKYYLDCELDSMNKSNLHSKTDMNLLNNFFLKATFLDLDNLKSAYFETFNLKAFQIESKHGLLMTLLFPYKVSFEKVENKLNSNIIQFILRNISIPSKQDSHRIQSFLKKILKSLTKIKFQSEFEVNYFIINIFL